MQKEHWEHGTCTRSYTQTLPLLNSSLRSYPSNWEFKALREEPNRGLRQHEL